MTIKPDGNGSKKALHFLHPPQRVVSLVPSMTESMFDLGFGETVAGITDYCIYPAESLKNIPRVGGPKNPRIDDIAALSPDLVLANWEENTRPAVEALEAAGVPVWVTFPKTVRQTLDVLWTLTGLYHSHLAAARLETIERSFEWAKAAAAAQQPVRFFCPIWYHQAEDGRDWWMAFNQHTYCHDLLALIGGENIFAARDRRYPLAADLGQAVSEPADGRDTRYPRVSLEEIRTADPEVILLPNEPFNFTEAHRRQLVEALSGTTAARQEKIFLVEGSLITWHGTRLARALQELPTLLTRL